MYLALIITQFYSSLSCVQAARVFKATIERAGDGPGSPGSVDANAAGNPARSMAQTQSGAGTAGPDLRKIKPPGPWVPDRPELPPILPAITSKVGEVFRPPTRGGNAPRSPQPSLRGGHREAPKVSVKFSARWAAGLGSRSRV